MVESRVGRSNHYAEFNIYAFKSSPHTIYALTHFTIYYSMSLQALIDQTGWPTSYGAYIVSRKWSAYKGLQKAKEGTIPMEVVEIKDIHVEHLPNLRSFYSGDNVEWSSLQNIVIKDCPNLKKFGFGKIKESDLNKLQIGNDTDVAYLFEASDDQLSTITEYIIRDNDQLHKALHNLQQSSHFTNLLLFQAENCDERLTKFMTILVKRSIQLQIINIEQCKALYCLFDIDANYIQGRGGTYLTQLKELNLTNVYELKSLWSKTSLVEYVDLRNLQKIKIKNCSPLKELLPALAAEMLHQLKEFKLEACGMLDSVVFNHYPFRGQSIIFPTLSKVEFKSLLRLCWFSEIPSEFPNMKTLIIERCPELETFTDGFTTIYPERTTDGKSFSRLNELQLDSCDKVAVVISSQTLQEFTNLKKLVVSHCMALEMVFIIHNELSHSTVLLNQLNELILIGLPKLTHIINKEFVKFYENLQILQVKQCKSLKWIPGSQMLTNMEISDCEVLEKIMIIDKEKRTKGKAIFSQLKDVVLKNLINLSIVFPSTSEFPSLETLEIANCPALLTFVEKTNELKDHPKSATSNYFFAESLSLNKLKVLYAKDQHVEELWHYSCPSESFCELETLTLSSNNKLLSVISSNMIIRFKNLKELTLDRCELLTEVFNLEDDKQDDNIQEIFSQLRTLAMSNLRGLTSVWNKEPQVPFFCSLVSLFIVHCDSLKSLFSPSAAKNLKKLKLLRLCNCENIEVVISSDKDQNVSIIFPEMECLILKDLPKLVNFCRQSGTIDWPNLQTLRISNIPSMESFSRANLKTPLLRSIFITFVEKIWLGNLKSTVSYIYTKSRKVASNKKPNI